MKHVITMCIQHLEWGSVMRSLKNINEKDITNEKEKLAYTKALANVDSCKNFIAVEKEIAMASLLNRIKDTTENSKAKKALHTFIKSDATPKEIYTVLRVQGKKI